MGVEEPPDMLGSFDKRFFTPCVGLGPVPGVSKNTRPDPFPDGFFLGVGKVGDGEGEDRYGD